MRKPYLYLTVGLPGCGKSHVLNKLGNVHAVSADAVREELYGDASVQYTDEYLASHGFDESEMSEPEKHRRGSAFVWERVYEIIREDLIQGKDAAMDGVSLTPESRKEHMERFADLAVFRCLYFEVDLETCLARNAGRKRHVKEDVIREMAETLVVPALSEGFEKILVIDEAGNIVREVMADAEEDSAVSGRM